MGRPRCTVSGVWVVAAILGASAFALSAAAPVAPAERMRLPDLDRRLVDPFEASADTNAIVFLFLSVDCPISNRYAPEIRRLFGAFAARGVRLWLIYPNPAESSAAIRRHLEAFAYPGRALRDPAQAIIGLAKATVTPEAAVFDRRGTLVYHGRIDDRYVNVGLQRPAPTTHDLEEALGLVVAGRPVPQPATQAVGCFIADFLR
jgi:hypothetical protein